MCLAHRTSVQVRLGGLPDLRNGCLSLCWQTLMELKVGTLIGSASTGASAFVEVRFGSGIVRSAFGAVRTRMFITVMSGWRRIAAGRNAMIVYHQRSMVT